MDQSKYDEMSPDDALRGHPCFDKLAHHRVGRMHIPVARACNVACRYCQRRLGGQDHRPGVAHRILTPAEALDAVTRVVETDASIRVIGVAGPGDALANDETFEALRLVDARYPHLVKCISTNGLLLVDKIDELAAAGVSALSVTMNAVDPTVGELFYSHIRLEGMLLRAAGAFEVLYARQRAGIALASSAGMTVKINTVLVPELNGGHTEQIAQEARCLGAKLMNIMPLKPLGQMRGYRAPTCLELEQARHTAERHIRQFRLCKQCRADAVGIPGHDEHASPTVGEPTLGESFARVPMYH